MKIDRLIGIIMVLLEKKRVSAQALADMYEVSLRTVYRDVDAINSAGIPIHSVPGVGGGFEIMSSYQLDRTVFSNADLAAILMGLGSVSSLISGSDTANALAKVRRLIPQERVQEITAAANQISIDTSPWMGNDRIYTWFEVIKTAMQQQKVVAFSYSDRQGQNSKRTVEPQQLVLKDGHWYLSGYCLQRQDFRLFKLSRIAHLQVQEDTFVPRACRKQLSDFAEHMAQKLTDITLRIHHSILDRVLDYCPAERVVPVGDAQYQVALPFIADEYGYAILLGFGDKCVCLAPADVRSELQRRIHSMAMQYGASTEPSTG